MSNIIGTVLFSLIALAITVVLIKNLSGGGAWLKGISPSLPSNWKDFFEYPAVLMGCAWFLAVVAALCLHPALCLQAITRYPGLVIGFHAILLACALMWQKQGSNAGKWFLSIILVVAFLSALGEKNLLPKAPSFGTTQKRVVTERSKKTEALGPSTEIVVSEEKWSDPIIRIDGWNWSLDYRAEKKARIRIERGNKILGEWDFGGGLPPATTISSRPKDKIFLKSLDGNQKIFVQYIDRS